MVLTEFASQIAARRAKAQHRRTGQEMVEWFFLNRINAKTAGAALDIQHKLVALSFAHKAQTTLAIFKAAKLRVYFTNKTLMIS